MMMIKSVLAVSIVFLQFGCKTTRAAQNPDSSDVSSISIPVPNAITNALEGDGEAVLSVTKGWNRYFTCPIQLIDGSDTATISFSKDDKGSPLRKNDNLGQPQLAIRKNGKVIYSAYADQTSFIINAGVNQISFKLQCVDATRCQKGDAIKIIPVDGLAGGKDAIAATLEANVQVATGASAADLQKGMNDCKTEVSKLDCKEWESRVKGGEKACRGVLAASPDTDSPSRTKSNLAYCKTLGVIE